MKLYGFSPSPNTWKVRALAAHLGIPLDYEFVDLTKGASRTPAYLAINPTGRTPALVDGDLKLWESEAIMQYLASQRPNSLWPNDARARADIMRWQSWQLAHWGKDVTLADFSVAAVLFHAEAAELPLAPYAKIREWFGRVSALPCWSQTAPQMPAAAA